LAPGLFQKKWFLALFIAMIIILIIETSLIIFFVAVSSLGRQTFPSLALAYHLRPGCSTLTATIVSTTATNRTFDYSCSGSGALRMPPSGFGGPADCCGADSVLVSPSLTLPQGYLSLSLVNTELGNCTKPQIQLQNGQNITLGGPTLNPAGLSYDYCAVISGQTGSVEGFSIVWNPVPWPGLCCTLSASPAQLTVPPGQNASSTVTVTALGKFFGTVSFASIGGSGSLVAASTWTIAPQAILVKPQSSNTTTVTISILRDAVPQTITLTIYTYPNRYYTGDTINIIVKVT
jgi:hypothetical protein